MCEQELSFQEKYLALQLYWFIYLRASWLWQIQRPVAVDLNDHIIVLDERLDAVKIFCFRK